jgi:hypothetical protein
MTGDAIGVFDGGQLTAGSATVALIDLDSSRLVAGGNSLGDILNVDRVGGANAMTRPAAHLRGPLLHARNGSTLDITGGFVAAANGGRVVVSGPGASTPLVSIEGGSHTVATGGVRAMFDLAGREGNVVRENGLVVDADRPLQHSGRLLDLDKARIGEAAGSGRFVGLDQALLEASLPLLAATNGSLIRTASHAVDLSTSRLTAVGDLIQLNASQFDVVRGALASVGGGGALRVGGNLITLANGSTLNLLNGPVLNVSGNSMVDITGALIAFSGAGNVVNINNTLCANGGCVDRGGLRVQLNGTTPASNVIVNNPITGAGTVNIPANAAHLSVSGAGSRVIIGPR